MPIYPYGKLIRQRREELGFSQQELAAGICSVPTLSRIENGERLPSKEHNELLLQRLGLSDTVRVQYVTEQSFAQHALKYRIRQAIIHNKTAEAAALLDEFEAGAEAGDEISEQFLLIYRTILDTALACTEGMERFLTAIRMTRPGFDPHNLPPMLSYEEIVAISNYAATEAETGNVEDAIAIYRGLARLYQEDAINPEEALRTQLMVLYNLSKYLGLTEKYGECVQVCEEGIRIARETGKCRFLDMMLYNKAWSLLKRGRSEDRPEAKECLRLAICCADAMGSKAYLRHYQKYMEDNFGAAEA